MSILDFVSIDQDIKDPKTLKTNLEDLKSRLNMLIEFIHIGSGTPEGAETGSVGHIFLRTDGGAGTTLYVKQSGSGNTGWVGK